MRHASSEQRTHTATKFVVRTEQKHLKRVGLRDGAKELLRAWKEDTETDAEADVL